MANLAAVAPPAPKFKYGLMNKVVAKGRAQAASEVQNPYNEFLAAGQKALPGLYAPAYRSISQQFAPQFEGARTMLATNPALQNSGTGNRLNRILQQGAFGSLSQSMGQTSAGVAQGGLDLLSQLIQRRQEERYRREAEKRQKKGIGGTIGSFVGAGLGAVGGPALSAIGSKIGGRVAAHI